MDETEFVRHVRLDVPLQLRVDGKSGRGVISGMDQPGQRGENGA